MTNAQIRSADLLSLVTELEQHTPDVQMFSHLFLTFRFGGPYLIPHECSGRFRTKHVVFGKLGVPALSARVPAEPTSQCRAGATATADRVYQSANH